jgi:hypothetical protein
MRLSSSYNTPETLGETDQWQLNLGPKTPIQLIVIVSLNGVSLQSGDFRQPSGVLNSISSVSERESTK